MILHLVQQLRLVLDRMTCQLTDLMCVELLLHLLHIVGDRRLTLEPIFSRQQPRQHLKIRLIKSELKDKSGTIGSY